jgi:hypothetical protein
MTQSRATLTILSEDLSVNEVSDTIGESPDWSVEKGTAIKGEPGNVHRYTAVGFESRVDSDAPPAAHVEDVLARVEPAKEAIRRLAGRRRASGSRGVPVKLSVHLESSRLMTGLEFSDSQLSAIADFGAHLGIAVDASPAIEVG